MSDGIITANAKLVELDLSDNAFGPDGVKACVKLLTSQACYSLTTLKLNNNGLGIGGGKVSKAFSLCVVTSLKTQITFWSATNRFEGPVGVLHLAKKSLKF